MSLEPDVSLCMFVWIHHKPVSEVVFAWLAWKIFMTTVVGYVSTRKERRPSFDEYSNLASGERHCQKGVVGGEE